MLRPGFVPSDALAREIQEFVKVQLAAHEYPRFVQFAETLPMTATGKVLRRELRALGYRENSYLVPANAGTQAAWPPLLIARRCEAVATSASTDRPREVQVSRQLR